MIEITLAIIKPDAVEAGNTGLILADLEEAGFLIMGLRMLRLSVDSAREFYDEHQGKKFFDPLVKFMTSGPVVVAALSGENAVSELRRVVGDTDPAKAEPGTIRALYGRSKRRNAIHASDSEDSAARELGFFFSFYEIIESGP
ncbi:MAG TPA: nucleoside-diphosphate kinase [archaeon]|nr:nucleoside-diphosphate kinase [archaeon]